MHIFFQSRRLKPVDSRITLLFKRISLSIVLMAGVVTTAQALGLGELRLKSALGQNLRAELALIVADAGDVDASCVRAKIETTDGTLLAPAQVSIRQAGLQKFLSITTRVSVNEPALKIVVNASCDIQLHREFLVLLDPPQFFLANAKDNQLEPARDDQRPVAGVEKASKNAAPESSPAAAANLRKARKNKEKPAPSEVNPEQVETATVRPPEKKPKVKKNAVNRDILRLSDDALVPLPAQGLKISDTLSTPSTTQNIASLEELRQAQRQMAALLRNEKSSAPTLNQDDDNQKILQKLQAEMTQLKKQSALDKAALEALKNNSVSQTWVFALAALSVFALAVIGLLVVVIRRLQTQAHTFWWEQAEDKKQAERRKNLEDIVNDVQASYEPELTDERTTTAQTSNQNAAMSAPVNSARAKKVDDGLLNNTDQFFQRDIPAPKTPTLEDTNTSVFNFFSTRASSVKVEEISDVTQEAEFWMSVNDPHRAIEILDSQARLEYPDSPLPWLYLLDLYRIINDKEKYDELRARFSKIFNAHIPDFDSTTNVGSQRHVDDMPHLMGKICDLWNMPEVVPFLQSLLVDDREGQRVGFELSVYKDLLMLIAIANEVHHVNEGKVGRTANQTPDQNSEQRRANDGAINTPATPGGNGNSVNHAGPTYFPPEPDPDLGMIEFELIDFPREDGSKK